MHRSEYMFRGSLKHAFENGNVGDCTSRVEVLVAVKYDMVTVRGDLQV